MQARLVSAAVNALALRLVHAVFLSVTIAIESARWLLRRRFDQLPTRAPAHVGIVVGSGDTVAIEDQQQHDGSGNHSGSPQTAADLRALATMIGWCSSAGIEFLTVCDVDGALMQCAEALREELRAIGLPNACVLMPGEEPHGAPAVRLLSLKSGRDDIVHAARQLCERVHLGQLQPSAINEKTVEGELRANVGFPEPSLVLQCCPELHLGGLLPWHCRVTQFVHLGELSDVKQEQLHRALVEFAGVQQRHGK